MFVECCIHPASIVTGTSRGDILSRERLKAEILSAPGVTSQHIGRFYGREGETRPGSGWLATGRWSAAMTAKSWMSGLRRVASQTGQIFARTMINRRGRVLTGTGPSGPRSTPSQPAHRGSRIPPLGLRCR
jgi:hypothetical protein